METSGVGKDCIWVQTWCYLGNWRCCHFFVVCIFRLGLSVIVLLISFYFYHAWESKGGKSALDKWHLVCFHCFLLVSRVKEWEHFDPPSIGSYYLDRERDQPKNTSHQRPAPPARRAWASYPISIVSCISQPLSAQWSGWLCHPTLPRCGPLAL